MSLKTERRQRLLPDGEPRYVRCYDNGGRSADRYTVVFTGRYRRERDDEFMYLAMNDRPFHPQGFGQHGWSKSQIDRPSGRHLGRRIRFKELPPDCQRAVLNSYQTLWNL